MSELGQRIKQAGAEQYEVMHPENPLIPGITQTLFAGPLGRDDEMGPYDAVVPSISGRAWITSFNQLVLDPTDPFQEGFVVGRPWQPER